MPLTSWGGLVNTSADGGDRFNDDWKRILHATGPDRSTHDDDKGRQLEHRPDVPAFEGLATEDGADCYDDA